MGAPELVRVRVLDGCVRVGRPGRGLRAGRRKRSGAGRVLARRAGGGGDDDGLRARVGAGGALDAVADGEEGVEALNERRVAGEEGRDAVDHAGRVDSGDS
jgi:hypothetical protein